jgi:hypothetical protein
MPGSVFKPLRRPSMNVRGRIFAVAALVLACGWARAQDKKADEKSNPDQQTLSGKVLELGITPNPKNGGAPVNVNDVFANPGPVVVAIYSGDIGNWQSASQFYEAMAHKYKDKLTFVKVDQKNLAASGLLRKLNISTAGGMTLTHFYLVQVVQGSAAVAPMVRHEFDSASPDGTKILIKNEEGKVVDTKIFSGFPHYLRAGVQKCLGLPMGLPDDSDTVKFFPCGTP